MKFRAEFLYIPRYEESSLITVNLITSKTRFLVPRNDKNNPI